MVRFLKSDITAIANAIRNKTGNRQRLTIDEMITAVHNMQAKIPEGTV